MSSDSNMIRGHCGCGELRFTIDASQIERDLQLAAYCHCSRCQRLNGTPFIWTNHWLYRAVTWQPEPVGPPPGAPDARPTDGEGRFSPAMDTYETIKGRKWKLRCRTCGTPMGSWNAAKGKWTIWPTTIARKVSSAPNASTGVLAEGDLDVPNHILPQLQATHHQFYGPWRSITLQDGLDKWLGYGGESEQITDNGQAM